MKRVAIKAAVIMLAGVAGFGLAALATLAQTPEGDQARPPDFFIEAEVNNTTPYLGQQIIYVVSRYQATEFPNRPYYEDHPFTGFWNTPLIQRPIFTTTRDGQEYRVHQTHIALFATRPGAIRLDPARLVIPGNGREADTILESQAIELQIKPLPANAPPDFKGAVGQFDISARLSGAEGQVNQALTLILEIKGTGNIETLVEPGPPDLPNWRLLDSEMTTEIPLSKEVVKGSRQFIWTLVPGRAGDQQIPPIAFSYFDPETERYQTISTGPIPITIQPNPASAFSPNTSPPLKQEVKRLSGDIRHIKAVPARLNRIRLTAVSYFLFYLVGAVLPLLAIGAAWAWRQWRRYRFADTPQARRRRAYRQAKTLLAGARRSAGDPFVIARRALLDYLSDKLDQSLNGLTSDQLTDRLKRAGLDPKLIEAVDTLLAQAEAGRFAPSPEARLASQTLLARTQRLIEDLEAFFR